MPSRASFLIAFTALLLSNVSFADDGSELPSLKARVVIPILKKFAPAKGLHQKDVLAEIEKILGTKSSRSKANGIEGEYTDYLYTLDDGTHVEVLFIGDRFLSIVTVDSSGKREALYPSPAT